MVFVHSPPAWWKEGVVSDRWAPTLDSHERTVPVQGGGGSAPSSSAATTCTAPAGAPVERPAKACRSNSNLRVSTWSRHAPHTKAVPPALKSRASLSAPASSRARATSTCPCMAAHIRAVAPLSQRCSVSTRRALSVTAQCSMCATVWTSPVLTASNQRCASGDNKTGSLPGGCAGPSAMAASSQALCVRYVMRNATKV